MRAALVLGVVATLALAYGYHQRHYGYHHRYARYRY
jgi:hypothetical protein